MLDVNKSSLPPDAVNYLIAVPTELISDQYRPFPDCQFTSGRHWLEDYGPFPNATDQFQKLHLEFELRLCVRRIATHLKLYKPELLLANYQESQEVSLIGLARRCDYTSDAEFERFAYAYMLIGPGKLLSDQRFLCDPSRKASNTSSAVWQLRFIGIKHEYLLGLLKSRELLDRYLRFESKVLCQRQKELEKLEAIDSQASYACEDDR
jgi:hypothetical protein